MGTSKNPHFIPTDGTTGETTSHLTNPAKNAGQVIGYSHSTKLSAGKLLAGHPKDDSQVAGYAALRQWGKQASRVAAARKKFLAYISTICGAAKFFSFGSPKGYPSLKLRFPRLAFGRTLNF